MIASTARNLANQENAKKSTGPRTAQGKLVSRGNAFKHGLTGQGVVLPHEDAVEVAQRFDGLRDQFHPATPMGKILVHRVAFLSVRLERCADQEAGHLGTKIRHAREDYDLERQVEVATLLNTIGESPATTVRKLLRTPEGIDALIMTWLDLKTDLDRFPTNPRFWTAAHCERANHLTGRGIDDIPLSRINELSQAIRGDFSLLDSHEGAGLDQKSRQAWARERLAELIDEEVAALRNCFENLDHEAFERDREEAPKRALFDTSKEAILARRYEAAAERGMFRALRELGKVEREAVENPPVYQARPVEPLGSFGTQDEADDEPETEEESRPVASLSRRSNAVPRSSQVEVGEEVGVRSTPALT